MSIYRLRNSIQDYAWGSTNFIPDLLGYENPEMRPQAELWMGAHPKAPSSLVVNGKERALDELIRERPVEVLGEETAARFGPRLPFLFKVLSAAQPLSIQAHPDAEQAREGFEAENGRGIPLDASYRNYRDASHKPEVICALTPFWAMCSFRQASELASEVHSLSAAKRFYGYAGAAVSDTDPGTLQRVFRQLISLDRDEMRLLIHEVVSIVSHRSEERYRWVGRLAEQFPDDFGTLCPLLLNVVRLEPGEALFLGSGELHAYLLGSGIELMANSDNVLRGGLTGKHVDISELLSVLRFKGHRLDVMKGIESGPGVARYPAPVSEFMLDRVLLEPGATLAEDVISGVEIGVCTAGSASLFWQPGRESMKVGKGDSWIVLADTSSYSIIGEAEIYRASVPRSGER